jgi:hypothetical protein
MTEYSVTFSPGYKPRGLDALGYGLCRTEVY